MRLTDHQKTIIVKKVVSFLGNTVTVKLFGSRLNDHKKGGDIDLLIKTTEPVDNPAWLIARLQAALMVQLGERKIDIILQAPNLARLTIHEIADREGDVLCC